MKEGPNIVRIAALIGDQARAEVLTSLMADRALTAGELAQLAGVTKQTISAHLAKLLDAGLLAVATQGRHRYFRLADGDVAHLLESLMGVAFRTGALRLRLSPRDPALRKARVCYDHLAGEWAVLAYEALLRQEMLKLQGSELTVTRRGREWFQRLDIDTDTTGRRAPCRACLDWSERRYHLAGALGAAFLARIQELGWARRLPDSRAVLLTASGKRGFRALLGEEPNPNKPT
jgi:DNA-binding transcriptional ArsR family regulator